MQLGLVGLPNVGKTTLFNALTRAGATVANYPFTTIDPAVGVAPVPDPRLGRIAEIVRPQQMTPATLRVVDIAGLVKGASQGEGLGNQFLSHIRAMDAIAMVVRCFEDENVAHVTPTLDPIDDIETVQLELVLSDLEMVERQIERMLGRAKANPREFAAELEALESVAERLRAGDSLLRADLSLAERDATASIDLLTNKPLLYVANVAEGSLPAGGDLARRVAAYARERGTPTITLCAALEAELVEWEPADARVYASELGLERTGMERFVAAGYALLDYITFFTTTGDKEVRAWNLQRGRTAIEAAGRIHTDLARGFIRAEVVSFEALDRAGSMAHAREAGALRLEGRDYVVQDGDVLHIRFNL